MIHFMFILFCLSAEHYAPKDSKQLLWPPSPALLEMHLRICGCAMELYVRRVLDITALLTPLPPPPPYSPDAALSLMNGLDVGLQRQVRPYLSPLCPVSFDGVPPVVLCRSQPWLSTMSDPFREGFTRRSIHPTFDQRASELRPWTSAFHHIDQIPTLLSLIAHSQRLGSVLLDPRGHGNLSFDALPIWASSADRLERTPLSLISRGLTNLQTPASQTSPFDVLSRSVCRELSLFSTTWLSWKALTMHLEHITPSSFTLMQRVEHPLPFVIYGVSLEPYKRRKMVIPIDRFIVPETTIFDSRPDALDDTTLLLTVSPNLILI